METTLMEITPQIAASFLEKNTRNRPLNVYHVRRLAKEMEMGRWKMNGDTIRFNGDSMIDGQHRCAAGVRSGVTFRTLVVRGLSEDVFSTIDAGKNRSGGDTLALMGIPNGNTVAACLKFVDRIVTGQAYTNGKNTVSNSEVRELFVKYPNISESIAVVPRRGKSICASSILAGLHYLFALRDAEAAGKFVDDVINGIGLQEGDSVYLLRERLLQNSYMKQKLRPEFTAALCIKAWNARRLNKKLSVLKFMDSETFPLIAD
jgi:hypothetical protein